jgi:hypothetical protein
MKAMVLIALDLPSAFAQLFTSCQTFFVLHSFFRLAQLVSSCATLGRARCSDAFRVHILHAFYRQLRGSRRHSVEREGGGQWLMNDLPFGITQHNTIDACEVSRHHPSAVGAVDEHHPPSHIDLRHG